MRIISNNGKTISFILFQEAKDPFVKAVLDGRQLALKVKKMLTYPFL